MKTNKIHLLFEQGEFANSDKFSELILDVRSAITAVHNPPGSGSFLLNNTEKHCNGVTPIQESCLAYLEDHGWLLEYGLPLATTKRPGRVDAVYLLEDGKHFAVEWETGNISSSHRALNKLCIGMLDGILAGGMLIVPSRSMYP